MKNAGASLCVSFARKHMGLRIRVSLGQFPLSGFGPRFPQVPFLKIRDAGEIHGIFIVW
jgi:hypothetical protein